MENFSENDSTGTQAARASRRKYIETIGGGATIPFISRYRKEATGGMDEVQIGEIQTRNEKLRELAKRKETVLSTIEEQEKLTPELRARIEACWDATELEDIYLPISPSARRVPEWHARKGWSRWRCCF